MESASSSINNTESIRRQYKEIIENPSKNPSELIELFKLAVRRMIDTIKSITL